MPVFPASEPRETQPSLIGESAASGIIVFFIGGGLFAGLGSAAFAAGAADDAWIPMVFGGLFALIGLGLMTVGGMQFLASQRLAPPAVTITVQPLYLGESFCAHVVQRVRKKVDINSVTVKLICREWVQYQQGTSTSTSTHEVHTSERSLNISGTLYPPDSIEGDVEFTIPEDAMHSFDAPDNRIEWILHVHSDIAKWPDYRSDVNLQVAAAYVQSEAD